MPDHGNETDEQADAATFVSARHWLGFLLIVIVGAVYISSFWGKAAVRLAEWLKRHGDLLPLENETVTRLAKSVSRWSYVYFPYVRPWWQKHMPDNWTVTERSVVLVLAASVVLGMLVPALVLKLARYRLRDVGAGLPNVLGWRLVAVSAVLSVPFAVWLFCTTPVLPSPFPYVCGLLTIIPEHFLICGIMVAILLPGRKLPDPVPIAPIEGPKVIRGLRWLGLAQPRSIPQQNRILAWFGLTGWQLGAIAASGLLFWMVHFGKPPVELFLSLPGGIAVAYVTLRSHSIWPAIIAHYTLNAAAVTAWLVAGWIG